MRRKISSKEEAVSSLSQVLEEEDHASATRNRDGASSRRDGRHAAQRVEAVESWPASGAQQHDSKEVSHEEEQESASCPTARAEGDHQAVTDQGWAWMVLVAATVVHFLTLAFPLCISVFYTELQTEFNTTNAETSLVQSIMIALLHVGGPLCSMLVERVGCQVTVMVGGFLSGLGMTLSYMARTITDLYITSGITGLGLCFSFQPSLTMLNRYFVRRRATANAVSSSGTALGLACLPQIAKALLTEYGWRSSFLVMGGMLLNCCVCGAVMRPIAPGPKQPRHSRDSEDAILLRFITYLGRHVAFDLLKTNFCYCVYIFGMTWLMLGYLVPVIYLVPYATHHNISLSNASFLMTTLGGMSILAKPITAVILGLPRFEHFTGSSRLVYVLAGAMLVNGLSSCICGTWTSFEVLLVYSVVFGLSMSAVGSLMFTVLKNIVGGSSFLPALGLLALLQSVTVLSGPPLAGTLMAYTKQYSSVFYASSAAVSSAALFIGGFFFYLDCKRDEEEEEERSREPDLNQLEMLAPAS